jgi:hypothetical protein
MLTTGTASTLVKLPEEKASKGLCLYYPFFGKDYSRLIYTHAWIGTRVLLT